MAIPTSIAKHEPSMARAHIDSISGFGYGCLSSTTSITAGDRFIYESEFPDSFEQELGRYPVGHGPTSAAMNGATSAAVTKPSAFMSEAQNSAEVTPVA